MSSELDEPLAQILERGRFLHQQGELAAALSSYEQVLERDPTHVEALNLLGVISAQSKNFDQALRYFDAGIALEPNNAALHRNRGLALKEIEQLEAAVSSLSCAIEFDGQDLISYYARASIYRNLGQLEAALDDYGRSIAINPQFANAYFNRATLLHSHHKLEAALADYDRAIALTGDNAEAFGNRGHVLHQLKRIDEAVSSYQRAIAIRPDPMAYVHLGNAMRELHRPDEALECYRQAIAIKPDFAHAYVNRGVIFYERGNIDEALRNYDRALEIDPKYAEAYFNRACVLRSVQQFEPAIADFEKAAELQPSIKYLPGALLEAKLQVCDWSGLNSAAAHINAGIERGEPVSHPFAFLTFSDNSTLQKKCAEIFVRDTCPSDELLGPIGKRAKKKRIRVGYFSADFREHPVARLIAELISIHDRSRFEIFGFSLGPDTQDAMRKRLEQAFDRFIDVRQQSDRDIALLARRLNVDIAVDLGGYTAGSRTGIFALRAAPIQISYLGYPGTMGSTYMDYLLADDMIVPVAHQQSYSEKILYLPSFQVNDPKKPISNRVFTRSELNIPSRDFVFCCFNGSYKIMPQSFNSWMRILTEVRDSILLLDAKSDFIAKNLRKEAHLHRVDPARLIFGAPLTLPDWLARNKVADLFLDTLPYNAGTTASDALWTGLPVLTLVGECFTGRMAASLLRAIELPELITTSAAQYETLAIELARNPNYLAQIKARLAQNRSTRLLFDQQFFARNLEDAFNLAQERFLANLPPDHIRVGRLSVTN